MSLTVGRQLRFRLPVRPDSARSFSNRLKFNHCQPCVWINDDPHRSSAQVGNGRIQRAIDESVIPDWLSFRCGEDGANDDWSCGAACGNLLRIARARTGMSQRELAEAAGVAQSTIGRIESGARQPSLPVPARILAAVDLELRITVEDYDSTITCWMRRMPALLTMPALLGATSSAASIAGRVRRLDTKRGSPS
jgi:transcriptional regulator with XRE-family HTH domain